MAAAVVSALVAGCATTDPLPDLRRRAAFDLQCDERVVRVKQLSSAVVGVEGCGDRAVYHWLCDFLDMDCRWVRDPGDVACRQAGPAPESAPQPAPAGP